MTRFKVSRDNSASNQRQAGLYQGQIWGCKFARQLTLRLGRGEMSYTEAQRLIREVILKLEAEVELLPQDTAKS